MGTVTIYRTYYLADDAVDGDIPRDNVETEVYDEMTAREAVDLIRHEGLRFDATNAGWAANPDGSYISNYISGQRCEVSAHLSGFHPRVAAAIAAVVDR